MGDAHLGGLGRGHAVGGLALDEAADESDAATHVLAGRPIDTDRIDGEGRLLLRGEGDAQGGAERKNHGGESSTL